MPHQNSSELSPAATKENLKSWWKQFTTKKGKREDEGRENEEQRGIFGMNLAEGMQYASVPICMTGADGQQYVYGYIPTVVAKCGMFLKSQATTTEGIFRLSGSAKRIKELQTKFDAPPLYGRTLDWTGYSVHDAANIFRRYLNQLPNPVIPIQWYDAFRSVHLTHSNPTTRVNHYQRLIANLPKENQQLLLYILDLLAVFSSKSSENLMPSSNLASIFQPGILSHPSHNMSPEQYKLSQEVLGFLIVHQNYFLLSNTQQLNINTVAAAGSNSHPPSTNNVSDDNVKPLKQRLPFDSNDQPIKRPSLRRQSLTHDSLSSYKSSESSFLPINATSPLSSSNGNESQLPKTSGLVRSRTLPSKRPKYSENHETSNNSNSNVSVVEAINPFSD